MYSYFFLDTSSKIKAGWLFLGPVPPSVLNSGYNLTKLHYSGKDDNFNNKLIIFFKIRVNTSASSVQSLAGASSIPVAALLDKLRKIF